ncbi:MAG: hypothetical protein A2666_04515 [Parcubacteria group bacterium RIFCSPHIGHO2_01_FULL_47_10b]|nr:MAG: hypothetical protein A2666_04515 [Parcubacteria group bacterium RIFCSPHIGHO2_01_FULL_47_10b]
MTLQSPSGEVLVVGVPGRDKRHDSDGQTRICPMWYNEGDKRDRRFRRLLSKGWEVVQPGDEAARNRKQWKKHTDVVCGTNQTGDQTHGGQHASGEVENSPNRMPRGNRGSQNRRGKKSEKKHPLRLKVQRAKQTGNGAVYAPQPLRYSKEIYEAAQGAAELLARLVGKSERKTFQGTEVNVQKLLMSLEIGDNPIPYLETPRERPRIRVLITPDCSGSTQNWSGVGCAFAQHLSKLPDVDVVYHKNFNGELWDERREQVPVLTKKLLSEVDVVLYLGDADGYELCASYARQGANVVALDCKSASVADPVVTERKRIGSGSLCWVIRCSAKEPSTWFRPLKLVLQG